MRQMYIKNDIKILSYIAEHKFLSTKQLSALSQRTSQVIRRRLRYLEKEDLISLGQRGFGKGPGRRENIIILKDKGLALLRESGHLSPHASYVTDKTVSPKFIDHDLLVNWFIIHFIQVGRLNGRLSISYLTTSSHNLKAGSAEEPLLLEQFSSHDDPSHIHSFIPDGVFTITDNKTKKTLLFFLEVDMGTETLASTNRNPSDVREKIINYQNWFRSGRYKRYSKILNARLKGFRLLFLTNSMARLKPMCNLVQEMRYSHIKLYGNSCFKWWPRNE